MHTQMHCWKSVCIAMSGGGGNSAMCIVKSFIKHYQETLRLQNKFIKYHLVNLDNFKQESILTLNHKAQHILAL